MMAIFGGKFQELAQAAIRKQTQRPMDPYKAGGPSGYMERINRTRMGGRYQGGGGTAMGQPQQGGGGKPNRQMVQGNAGGQQVPWAGGGGRQPEWGPGAPGRTGGLPSKLLAATQGQGGQGPSGKPNRQMVQGNAGGGNIPSKLAAAMGGQQPGAGGGRMYAGGSPGWAGGQGPNGGGGGGSGKANRRTVRGNAGGGMIGRRGMRGRGRGIVGRMQPKRQKSALGTAAARATAARGMQQQTTKRGAFEATAR